MENLKELSLAEFYELMLKREDRIYKRIDELRTALKAEVAAVRTELKAEIKETNERTRRELKMALRNTQKELEAKMENKQDEIIAFITETLSSDYEKTQARFNKVEARLCVIEENNNK